jgi:hypothetical protein
LHGFCALRDRYALPLARIFVKPGSGARRAASVQQHAQCFAYRIERISCARTAGSFAEKIAACFALPFLSLPLVQYFPRRSNPHNSRSFSPFAKKRDFRTIFSPQIKANPVLNTLYIVGKTVFGFPKKQTSGHGGFPQVPGERSMYA